MKTLTLTAWVAVIIVAFRSFRDYKEVPRPQNFIWIALVWGFLGLLSTFISPEIAGLFGFGLMLALLYQLFPGPRDQQRGEQQWGHASDKERNKGV